MSTKTAFKRVALVAAAALAIGGISAVSAQAAAQAPTFAVTGGTVTNSGTTAVTATATVGTYEAVTLTFVNETATVATLSSTGVGTIAVPSLAPSSAGVATSGITSTGAAIFGSNGTGDVPGSAANHALAADTVALSATSSVAGTQTISITGQSGVASTVVITWGSAAVVAAQYSQVVAVAGSTVVSYTSPTFSTTGASSAITATGDAAGTQYAAAGIATMSSATAKMLTDSVSATITGPGTLGLGAGPGNPASTGRSISFTETAGIAYLAVYGDGTAGTATVTVVDGTAGVTLGTFTVTFVGAASKATATQGLFVLKAGSTTAGTGAGQSTGMTVAATGANVANTVALTGKLVDANGNAAGGTVQIVSSNTAVITAGSCSQVTLTAGEYQCIVTGAAGAVSGQTATVTFEAEDSSSNYTILAAPLTFTIGGAITAEAFTTDATSYTASAPVVLTITATDASKNKAYDQDITAGFVSSAVATTQLGGTDLGTLLSKSATTYSLINGVASYTGIYAPAVAGDFTISATDAASGNSEAVTAVTATSTGGSTDAVAQAAVDAANEATDAANAATDAANAAADSADAATQAAQDAGAQATAALAATVVLTQQVSKVFVKMNALSALLVRIIKKVHA